MYIELIARVVKITPVETTANGLKKFNVVLKKSTTNMMEELIETKYAVTVFPKDGNNGIEKFEYYKDSMVKIKVKVSSSSYNNKEGVECYITNMNFGGHIEKVENKLNETVKENAAKYDAQPVPPPDNLFANNVEQKEVKEKKYIDTPEGLKEIDEATDDLPF